MESKELVKKALECIDLNKLSDIVIDDIIEKAILSAVEKSPNKVDDALVGMLLPIVKSEAKAFVAKKIAELKAA